ncbi:MAG: phosphoribosylamine--glycine ligase [Magnetococcus sp. WYHC-3]
MQVLIIGSGGREHALVWKIARSPLVRQVWCAPGNPGIAALARCVPLAADDLDGLVAFATRQHIDMTVVGPEDPLVKGIVDRFHAAGLRIFGPSAAAAALEGSKAFMKALFARHHIPTAGFATFTDPRDAREHVLSRGAPVVVKTSGLAAGKGALVCLTLAEALEAVEQIMVRREFGNAGDEVVIEDFLSGEEASFIALVDGHTVLPLASAQDHKAVGEGDTGLNTGGMGAYSPAPVVTPAVHDRIMAEIMLPTVRAMAAEGRPYTGFLYAGVMVGADGGVKTLEFNARMGDPEAQPLLMRMADDLVPLLMAACEGRLAGQSMSWDPRAALCVVMTSGGYPAAYAKGFPLSGLQQAAQMEDVQVFHAGTRQDGNHVVNNGGRVLGVTALGTTVQEAAARAYQAVDCIHWQGAYCRRDIGHRAVARERLA